MTWTVEQHVARHGANPARNCRFCRIVQAMPPVLTPAEKVAAREAGAAAFAAGADRMVPLAILVGDDPKVGGGGGIEASQAWYAGWDAANLAEPVR